MLSVYFGDMPEAIYNTSVYFDNTYADKWLLDDFAGRVIKKVDKSTVLSNRAIESPVLGIIPPTKLSGGTKTLLLVHNLPNMVFNASTCGDNCAQFLLELGDKRDVTVNLHHLMNFGKREFTIRVANSDTIAHSMAELFDAAIPYL